MRKFHPFRSPMRRPSDSRPSAIASTDIAAPMPNTRREKSSPIFREKSRIAATAIAKRSDLTARPALRRGLELDQPIEGAAHAHPGQHDLILAIRGFLASLSARFRHELQTERDRQGLGDTNRDLRHRARQQRKADPNVLLDNAIEHLRL